MTFSATVVIPLYNASSFVRACLDSAVRQEHAPHEIIVIDDGSTDDSAEIVALDYPDVTLVRQPNRGVARARNAGAELASTDWVAFLDADDFWAPNHLTELAILADRFPESRLLATTFRRWAEGDAAPSFDRTGHRSQIRYFDVASRHLGIVHSTTAAVHRTALLRVGGFPDHTHGEDLACWALLALQDPVASSTAVTAVYRQATGGAMSIMPTQNPWVAGPSPLEWSDISPSCRIVAEALDSGGHRCDPDDLQRYLDSRISAVIRSQVVAGNRDAVARLRALRSPPFRWRSAPIRAAEHAPRWAVSSLAVAHHRMRPLVAGLRRLARG